MKTELRYGLLFAGIVVVYVLLEHFLGFNTTRHDIGEYTRFGGVVVPILGIYFGLREKRRVLEGSMTLGQGVRSGFWIALVQTTITTLWFMAYAGVINPDFMETMLEHEKMKMLAAGQSESDALEQLVGLRSMYAFPNMQIFQMGIGIAYGTLFAALFSFFMRTRTRTAS